MLFLNLNYIIMKIQIVVPRAHFHSCPIWNKEYHIMNTKSIWKFTEYTGYEVEIIDKCLYITKNQQETKMYKVALDSEYFFRLQKTQITVSDLIYFVNRLEKDKDEPITWKILNNIWDKVKPLKNNK